MLHQIKIVPAELRKSHYTSSLALYKDRFTLILRKKGRCIVWHWNHDFICKYDKLLSDSNTILETCIFLQSSCHDNWKMRQNHLKLDRNIEYVSFHPPTLLIFYLILFKITLLQYTVMLNRKIFHFFLSKITNTSKWF